MGNKAKRRERRVQAAALREIEQAEVQRVRWTWPVGLLFNLGLLAAVSLVLFRHVFLHPDEMLAGSDLVRAHTTLKAVQYRSFWTYGTFPLWDPTTLCGKSLVGDPLAALLNPLTWLFWVSTSPALYGLYFWAYVTLGAWGTFLWMRLLGSHPAGGVLAAIAFAASGKTAAHLFAGHMELLPGMLGLPWVLWVTERILQRRTRGSAVLLGGVLCLIATTGSVQALYLHGLAAVGYLAFRTMRLARDGDKPAAVRSLRLLALAGLVFVLGGMAWWLPVVRQALLLSARASERGGGYEFATMLSASVGDLVRLLRPYHGVGPPRPFASDPENGFFWETASYPGLVAVALALAYVVGSRNRRKALGLAALAVGLLVLALGHNTPAYRLAYEVIPGFDLFRVPGRLLFFSNLVIAAMAGLGLSDMLRGGKRWPLVGSAAIVLLAVLKPDPSLFSLEASLPALLAGGLLAAAALYQRGTISPATLAALVVGLAALDLGALWSRHVHTASPDVLISTNSVAAFLANRTAEEGPPRLYDPTRTVSQELAARVGLQSITGYHPGIAAHQLDLYRALWPPGEGSGVVELLMHSPRDIACTNVLDFMGVRYVVAFEAELDERFRRVFTTPAGEFERARHVFERTEPLPRAFVVPRGVTPERGQSVLEAVCAIDPREACVLEETIEGGAAFQPVVPMREQPGSSGLAFETAAPGLLVLSQSWHPDWVATVNGQRVPVHRANHGLLAVRVTTGDHDVRVWYRPWDAYLGGVVSGAFWLACVTRWGRSPRAATIRDPETAFRG